MAQIKLFGYTDKITVKAGDELCFHVSADGTDVAEAQLVRLIQEPGARTVRLLESVRKSKTE